VTWVIQEFNFPIYQLTHLPISYSHRAVAHITAEVRRRGSGRPGGDGSHRCGAACHRDAAGPYHLNHAVGPQNLDEAGDLVFGPRGLDDQRLGADVDDPRAVHVGELHDVRPRVADGGDLDEREIARDRGRHGDVVDAAARHELVEVRLEPA